MVSTSTLAQILIYVLAVVILAVVAVKAGQMSRAQGYRFGSDVIVRCRDGHLFTTTWVPMMSFKAIRFGLVRIQHCPVGNHVTAVRLMRPEDLTPAQLLEARRHQDSGIP